jgi:hypothetical protein
MPGGDASEDKSSIGHRRTRILNLKNSADQFSPESCILQLSMKVRTEKNPFLPILKFLVASMCSKENIKSAFLKLKV